MKIVLILIAVIFVSCKSGSEDRLRLLNAQTVYLSVELGKLSDSEGKAFFQKMNSAAASKLYNDLNQELRQLELDNHNPQKHFDAECTHSFDICKIRSSIETITGTMGYMLKARNAP